jgi:hypothetical protein
MIEKRLVVLRQAKARTAKTAGPASEQGTDQGDEDDGAAEPGTTRVEDKTIGHTAR